MNERIFEIVRSRAPSPSIDDSGRSAPIGSIPCRFLDKGRDALRSDNEVASLLQLTPPHSLPPNILAFENCDPNLASPWLRVRDPVNKEVVGLYPRKVGSTWQGFKTLARRAFIPENDPSFVVSKVV